MPRKINNKVILDMILCDLLSAPSRDAIIAAARLGYGAARNLPGVLMEAKAHGASVLVVAAAFGFLPDLRNPTEYIDMLQDDEFALGQLPADPEVSAAFALSRAVHPDGCAFMVG